MKLSWVRSRVGAEGASWFGYDERDGRVRFSISITQDGLFLLSPSDLGGIFATLEHAQQWAEAHDGDGSLESHDPIPLKIKCSCGAVHLIGTLGHGPHPAAFEQKP